jgi:hypothetical protein
MKIPSTKHQTPNKFQAPGTKFQKKEKSNSNIDSNKFVQNCRKDISDFTGFFN